MVYLLILIHFSEVFILDISSPETIPITISFDHLEASIFESVYYSVIDVCRIIYSKRHEQMFHFFLRVRSSPIRLSVFLSVFWVWEEGCWRSLVKDRLKEEDFLTVRFKHTIWKTTLLFFEEDLTERIIYEEILNFLHRTEFIKEF